ncbi:PREDICTED: uncharacterized protein LOC109149075 [Ipomoea nil]|uniref:uncharacterized protein LOC109149075 n=1 Tax=Ipomoea nil TaxID=35883 RepID=UPI000900D894|nr:PREDICTED: uncharacterized protein LOC109149075 [Ipomoea nil]
MTIVSWNCQGVGNKEMIRHAKVVMDNNNVRAICFLETKTSKADNLLKALSGLLLVWNSNLLNLEVVGSNSQTIHCKITEGGNSSMYHSFAYVRPNLRTKEVFWHDCRVFSESIAGPWVIQGDFNDIANINEHWGNDHVNPHNLSRFCTAFENCGLMEVNSIGPSFTWCRHIGGRMNTRRKLDRVFWNIEAQEAFPEAKAKVLTRTHSDHHPIAFIRHAGSAPVRGNRPYRFEAAWLTHDDYKRIWKTAWKDRGGNVVEAIDEVTRLSKQWNEEVFGNIFKRKRQLQARLQGIQNSNWYHSRGLQVLEKKLKEDLNKTLAQEELLWANQDGNAPTRHDGKKLNPLEAKKLVRPADVDEVKAAVFGMKCMGSPGPDGIQAAFYQDFWQEVGGSITKMVNEALISATIPLSLLEAFVTLIPKKDNPKTAADFRPITLLNVMFKIVSKVIVNRLRPLMNNLIGPHQNSFLPGRSTLDNIILTQDCP